MIAMGFPRNLKHATARREAGKKQSEESCLGLSRVTVWFSVAQSEPDRKTYFCTMARLWVGGLEVGISERDLEDESSQGKVNLDVEGQEVTEEVVGVGTLTEGPLLSVGRQSVTSVVKLGILLESAGMRMVVGVVVVVEATEVEVGAGVDTTEGAVEMTDGVVVMTGAVIDMHQIVAGVLTMSREDGAGALHMIVAVQEVVAPAAESWSSKMMVLAALKHQHRGASSCLPAGFPVRSSACCKSPL
ncbi:hypothetical protein ABBQ38_003879 [Trebouxia sp. C0009 RCD-2024]